MWKDLTIHWMPKKKMTFIFVLFALHHQTNSTAQNHRTVLEEITFIAKNVCRYTIYIEYFKFRCPKLNKTRSIPMDGENQQQQREKRIASFRISLWFLNRIWLFRYIWRFFSVEMYKWMRCSRKMLVRQLDFAVWHRLNILIGRNNNNQTNIIEYSGLRWKLPKTTFIAEISISLYNLSSSIFHGAYKYSTAILLQTERIKSTALKIWLVNNQRNNNKIS